MKRRLFITFGLILSIACCSDAWARGNPRLRAKIEAFYNQRDQLYGTKNLEGCMAQLTDDFQFIYFGLNRESSRATLKDFFDAYDELRSEHQILDISQSVHMIKVVSESKLEGRSRNKEWKVISQGTSLELLVEKGNALKIFRSTIIDKYRLNYVVGQTYRDAQTGFSFTAPKNWDIFPTTVHPTIQGCVFILAPDGTSAAMLGYVKAPASFAKQAAEGDEALGKVLSNTYRLIKSGPIRVNGLEGWEIESEFLIPIDQRERHRRRVYLNADGLLYVLCFDGMPFGQWDKVKDGFQFILDSIR
jgi:hypothetical protein